MSTSSKIVVASPGNTPALPQEPLLVDLDYVRKNVLVGASKYTLRKLCRQGVLKFKKVGGKNEFFIVYSSLKAFAGKSA